MSVANFSVTWSQGIRSEPSKVLPSHKANGQSSMWCLIGLQTLDFTHLLSAALSGLLVSNILPK